ncbi:MAG: Uncharacterised protein [Prochlorococcus marinus str. MIT 9215]|nr:MAG: Uncharacterised protein [Prochlorococcus marinus str. MIT 9215]
MAENPAQSSAQQEKQPANTTSEINKPAASNAVDAKAVDAKADVATAEIQSMADNKPEAQKATPATPETGKAEMPTASQAKPQLKNAAVDKETAKSDKAKPDQAQPDKAKPAVVKKTPAPKLEDKPFEIFIREDFIPSLSQALNEYGLKPTALELNQGKRPVVGGSCWMVSGDIPSDRRFWLCFSSDSINSSKTIALADPGTEPSLLEPFLIDEKKTTLPLLRSRLLQRLNGQKWLGAN